MFRIDRRFVKISGTRVSKPKPVSSIKDAASKTGAAAEGLSNDDAAALVEELIVSAQDEVAELENAIRAAQGDAASGDEGDDKAGTTEAGTPENAAPENAAPSEEEIAGAAEEAKALAAREAEAAAIEAAKKYMSAAEREIKERSDMMMAEARAKADKIVDDALSEAADVHQKAYDEGYAEGKSEGEIEGKRIFDEKLEQQRSEDEAELRRVLDEIARERERQQTELEEVATSLAVEIVRKIFNPAERELGTVFLSLIKNAFRQISTDGKFIIRVSPDEYERYFSSGAATIELDSGVIVSAAVLRDVSLDDGGLIIDADDVTVNAGLDSQLQYVQIAFESANQYEPE